MTKMYLAGRFDRKDELACYAAQLEDVGHVVTSRWLTGVHDHTTERELTPDDLAVFAAEDLEDIDAADLLVLFTERPDAGYMSGGRHVEFGYALARCPAVVIVGGPENVFHHGLTQYDTWDAFLIAAKFNKIAGGSFT